jgi:Tfp pilus assembly protein FimV
MIRSLTRRQTGEVAPPPPGHHVMTVRPGDTLWSLAHESSLLNLSPAAAARRCALLWAANPRAFDDDGALRPGGRLLLPLTVERPRTNDSAEAGPF